MILIDSDLLSLAYFGKPPVRTRVDKALAEGILRVPIMVASELLDGRIDALLKAGRGEDVLKMQERLLNTREFLDWFTLIHFDEAAAIEFDRLKKTKGLGGVGNVDLQIGSLALVHNATVATRNLRDFKRVPGLKIENWSE